MVPVREAPPPASAAQATVAHPSAAPAGSRRALLAAGALALAGVGGCAAAILLRPSTDALAPVRLLLAGRHPQQREAEALLVGHLAGRPDDPAALGLLALAHALTATTDFMAKNQMRIEKGRAAARRALERDPANADATVALAMNRPVYRNCQAYEDAVPAAALRFPHHWLANLSLAQVRAHTGRFAEALAPAEEATIREPNSPGARYWLALVQWGAGKLPAADATQVESLQRFPFDPTLFQQRFSFLALTGRAAEARSLGSMGHLDRPDDSDLPLSPEVALPVLDALEFGGIDRRRSAVAALVAARREGRVATFEVVPWIAALGDPDTALAMLPSYYFGTGPIGSRDHDRPRPGDFRHSYFLFLPPMAAVWPVPGFSTLLAEIGLDDFWHRSATTPDFRR
jgi:tetratricopeptide (TPR) repeat protein